MSTRGERLSQDGADHSRAQIVQDLAAFVSGGGVGWKGPEMHIERIGRPEAAKGVPVISFAAVHGGIVYVCGLTADPRKQLGDVKQQTREVLGQIDAVLQAAGTTKSKILTAQVWLTDMDDFAAHNDAWNEWVDSENPPVRACVHSPQLWAPGLRVEIMVTAAT